MEVTKDRISIRQGLLLLILAWAAPMLRVIPNYVSIYSKQASWVVPIIIIIPGVLLVLVLSSLFLNTKSKDLYEVYEKIFGKIINKIIMTLYILWTIMLASLYLRMYGERVLGAILYDASLPILLIVMSAFIYFAINQNIDVIGRLGELLLLVLLFIFFVAFILVMPDIKLENIWPVTYFDILPVLKGCIPVISLSSYITVIMILGDRISNKENMKKTGIGVIIFFSFLVLLLILETVGIFGYRLNTQFIFPYLATLKSIQIMGSIERVESLFISTWISSDFAIIIVFMLASLTLIKKYFKKNSYKKVSIWLVIAVFFIALNLASNIYEIEVWARVFAAPINIILFWGVPILAWIVGKFRKIV